MIKRLSYRLVLLMFAVISFVNLRSQSISRQITYVNLSRPNGGAVSSGDTLEIRAVISVLSGTTIYKVRFVGRAPINTTYIPGTLAAKTNEGATTATNTGNYSDATGDDRAEISGGVITMNLGNNAGTPPANGGTIQGGSTVPRFYSSSSIVQATFRVRVSVPNLSQVVLTGNSFQYATTNNGAVASYPLTDLGVLVFPQYGCNAIDPYNFVTDESGGTYLSGTGQDRVSSPIVTGFTYTTISSTSPNDGFYAVVKNSSHTETTNTNPPNSDKVFSTWNVFGDHTGTTDGIGNPPAGINQPGGYMLIVNASYTPGNVFTTNISGLLPNSTYTFSFWVRNLCGSCSGSPSGGSGTGPGVLPNLLLSINGLDYYGTGNITANNLWIQKSFTFLTGNWTTAAITVRNNAPGGGGNDWAIDDFTMNECLVLLPITFSELSANYHEGETKVNWAIAKDDMIEKYIVEYSQDGKAFFSAGEVKAKGGGKYSFIDQRTVASKMYYRVVAVNKDSKMQFSKVMVVKAGAKEVSLKVSPNPVQSVASVSLWSNNRQSSTIKLFDMSGRTAMEMTKTIERGMNEVALRIPPTVKDGIYAVQAIMEDGRVISEKIMVRRGQ